MKTAEQPTVFVVDDEPEFVAALDMLLQTANLAVCAFTSPRAFLRAIHPDDPGCVLLDVRMPSMSGLEVQEELILRGCRQPVLFLTGHGDIPMAVRATRAGALDFIEKPARDTLLLQRIRAALKLDRTRRKKLAAAAEGHRRTKELSPRELQIGQLLAQGLSSAEMARKLKRSVRTVEMHRLRLLRRLGVRNTAEAVREIIAAGLVPPEIG